MRYFILIVIVFSFAVLSGCQGKTMDLLDEPIREVAVSKSKGIGELNEEYDMNYTDSKSIEVFREGIVTSRMQNKNVSDLPHFDIFVQYENDLPTHALYIWLGEENKESILMYYVGEGETYVTTPEATNRLRELLLSN